MSDTPLLTSPNVDRRSSGDGRRVLLTATGDDPGTVVDAALSGPDPGWVLALVFAASADALGDAATRLRTSLPDAEIAGCTASGLVDRNTRFDAELQVTLVGGDGVACSTALATLGDDSRAAGRGAAEALATLPERHPNTALILLVDGLSGDTNHVVRGAYERAGALVPIVGGCAGDNLAMEATHQLIGDTVTTGSVIGIALSSTAPLGIGVRHGWNPIGIPMTVTAAEGTSILSLDDRPALDVYLETLDAGNEWNDEADFATFCQTRPLGLESRGGHHVRFIRGADFSRRSIEFLVAIPEGELVTLMEGGTDTVISAAGSAIEDAVAQLDDTPLGVIAFDCVACRGVIGDGGLAAETEAVARHLPPDAAIGGLYTYGEIARRGGNLGFHNQTMVVLALQ